MELIQYKIRSHSSRTPCPHGMTATCENCKITKPILVHVGSWMEYDCPFYGGHGENKNQIVCNYDSDSRITSYNSR